MISVRPPTADRIERYRTERESVAPPCPPTAGPTAGLRTERFRRSLGPGPVGGGGGASDADLDRDFALARIALQEWTAHRGSGVEVFPPTATVTDGATVAIVTRPLLITVVAACRVVSVVDEPGEFGFTYATLPGHPVCGYESFTIRREPGAVVFEVAATSKPGLAVLRLGGPALRAVQRRASEAYLTAVHDRVRADRTTSTP